MGSFILCSSLVNPSDKTVLCWALALFHTGNTRQKNKVSGFNGGKSMQAVGSKPNLLRMKYLLNYLYRQFIQR